MHRSNSDRADDMKNGLKGKRLKDVKNKEFRTNFKLDLFSFPAHITPSSGFSQ